MRKGLKTVVSGIYLLLASNLLYANVLSIGLVDHPESGGAYHQEWQWALRGGGAQFEPFDQQRLISSLTADISLLVVDHTPLKPVAAHAVQKWVRNGGLLIMAGAESAMQRLNDAGDIQPGRSILLSSLLGIQFAGYDAGLTGLYPRLIKTDALLSPLQVGDALRLGETGLAHKLRLEVTDATVLARAARLSPGAGGMVIPSEEPTIVTRPYGAGRVVFLSFSPALVARCYDDDSELAQLDCSGASQAHALMRWLTANLLWQEKKIQVPLLWESVSDKPHTVMITGDVHHNDFEVNAAVKMAKRMQKLDLPLSLYVIGEIAEHYPQQFAQLKMVNNLEISPHSDSGEVYWTKRFKFSRRFGILKDFISAQKHLQLPRYPEQRDWLISVRNESWQSDSGAWWAMEREGVGLVFDFTADSIVNHGLYLTPLQWFQGKEHQRLFVPLYERSIATPVDDFRLTDVSQYQMASLASAQAEPCCIPLSYAAYSAYVDRWHRLFSRLSSMGGLSEVWLWHPGGIAIKSGFADMEKTLNAMKKEPTVEFVRADVAATWRYNRELFQLEVERQADKAIASFSLSTPKYPVKPLPPDAPAFAKASRYWVLGELQVKGWQSGIRSDSAGRVVTVLSQSIETQH